MQIAVLGMGEMGSRMALSLLHTGHSVTVWNRSADRVEPILRQGAAGAPTPAAAVRNADVAFAMVRDDEASRRIWLEPRDGALVALSADAIAIESSTLSLPWIRELSGLCAARKIAFLDAPVVGSRAQADTAQLIHLVGGDAQAFKRAAPAFAAIGAVAHHIGPSGTGAALKLIVNAMLGVQVALLAELLGSAERLGLEISRAVEVLAQTPPCSPAAKVAAESIAKRSFAPAFPVELMAKDLAYLVDAIHPYAAPLSAAACAVFEHAIKAKLGGDNMTAVAKLYD